MALFIGTAFAGCLGSQVDDGSDSKNDPKRAAPQALATVSPTAPDVGESVRFDASAGVPAGAEGWTVVWNFGDGATHEGTTATHTYAAPGQYVVGLAVTNAAGKTATNDANLAYLTVAPADGGEISDASAPVAQAASSKAVVKPGETVAFSAGSSGGWQENPDYDPSAPYSPSTNAPFTLTADAIASYAWDFGDGATASEKDVNHTFEAPGYYPVKLTVTGVNGEDASYVVTIRVLEPAAPVTPAKNKHVFTHATLGEPESLDPAYDYESAGNAILQQTYETLFFYQRDRADKLVPVLATEMPTVANGGLSADGLTYTIHLRDGVKFHTGGEMTAEDVKFSLDRIVLMNDPAGPAAIYSVLKGAEHYMRETENTAADREAYVTGGAVEIVDEDTVRIRLERADPAFLFKLAYTGASVVSKDYVCKHMNTPDCLPPVGETRDPWMDTHIAGTGPFVLERWLPNQMVILKRFDSYWGDKPAMERVQIIKVDDTNTRLLMLYSGQADSAYVPPGQWAEVLGREGLETFENSKWDVEFIAFNQNIRGNEVPKGADGTPDPAFFADLHMRRAWVHAFDYETFHKEILDGYGQMLNGPFPEGIVGYDASIPKPSQDLTKAREELAKSNHPDGFSVTLYYNSGNTKREEGMNLLKQNLESLHPGIRVEVRSLEWATAYLPKLRAGELPVYYLGWHPDYAYPDNYIVNFAHSEKGLLGHFTAYKNPEIDSLLDEAALTVDQDANTALYKEAARKLNDDAAFLWLAQASNLHVQRDYVEGYYFNPMLAGNPNIGDYAAISKA